MADTTTLEKPTRKHTPRAPREHCTRCNELETPSAFRRIRHRDGHEEKICRLCQRVLLEIELARAG